MKKTLLAAFILCLTSSAALAADEGFHSPQTEAEKTLSEIHVKNTKEKLANTFFNGPTKEPYNARAVANHSDLFTKKLQHAWEQAEQSKDPIDMDVISCGDFHYGYTGSLIYRTVKLKPRVAIIEATLPDDYLKKYPKSTPLKPFTYKLIKEQTTWKLDGINCGETYRYNLD